MPNYICDLCGWQSEDRAAILSHMQDVHQVEDAGSVGSMRQEDGRLILQSGDKMIAIDLDAWLGAYLAETPDSDAGTLGAIVQRILKIPAHKRGAVLRAMDSLLAALEYELPADN